MQERGRRGRDYDRRRHHGALLPKAGGRGKHTGGDSEGSLFEGNAIMSSMSFQALTIALPFFGPTGPPKTKKNFEVVLQVHNVHGVRGTTKMYLQVRGRVRQAINLSKNYTAIIIEKNQPSNRSLAIVLYAH